MSGFEALKLLIKFKDEGTHENIIDLLSKNLTSACQVLNIEVTDISNLDTVKQLAGEFHTLLECESTVWNFVCFGYYVLIDHIKSPSSDDDLENLLSVNQQKDIRTLLEILLMFGLVPNLIPGVGVSLNARSQFANKIPREDISVIDKYIRVRFSTVALLECNKNSELRKFIVSRHLGDLLAALFQLTFAPLKKPNHSTSASTSSQFEISEELWNKLQNDRVLFKGALDNVLDSTYQPLLIKEIMILMGMDKPLAPKWLKSEASKMLCSILVKKDGILSLVRAVFDSDSIDTGVEWKHTEVLQKLIFDIGSVSMFPNFYTVICGQIIEMLEEVEDENTKNLYLILPRLFIKSIIDRRKDIFEREIFDNIISPIARCTKSNHLSIGILISESELNQSLKFIYQIFALDINTKTDISSEQYLLPYVDIFYQLYAAVCSAGTCSHVVKYTKAILLKILNDANGEQLSRAIQIILFRRVFNDFYIFNDNFEICLGPAGGIFVKKSEDVKINYVISEKDESFLNLIDKVAIPHQSEIFKIVFNEFCNIFLIKNTETTASVDLLYLETDQETFAKLTREKLVLLKILAKLAENKAVMEQLDTAILIKFIVKFLKKHENLNTDTFEDSEGLFLTLMLLDILIDNFHDFDQLKCLINPLEAIAQNSTNDELKIYISKTVEKIRNNGLPHTNTTKKSQLDEALEELCDPLLPVRAHGLMTLTKLIESKDKEACARQQYILCIFQENLKNTDSYVYLTAINGIATLANVYTDSVIEILTEEYVNTSHQWRDDEEHKRVRMNLGEVLVRVTKMLGEMAPKYKAILLNAFLFGTKDDDNLIRASSLSNLGQACEILGYKLGNATTEILQCLEAIIETDKAIEAKRAAVMVLYQLLKGLGPDTIVFLKDALLPIYRKLKDIYTNSNDDVMKLHAQLALEELNNATRNFLLPPVQMEKDINIFI